jgi:two-component system, OmpR family, phosphate regulon sensor histidine kinase PhoR
MPKKNRKHFLTIGLMASSVTLLVLLQVFWLRNSYKNAYTDVRREANSVFRSAVFDMWDSIVAKNIRRLPIDSLPHEARAHAAHDSITAFARIENKVIRRGILRDSSAIKVILSTTDSITGEQLKPIVRRITTADFRGDNENQTFIIRLGSDSLDRSALESKTKKALVANDIDLDFRIQLTGGPGMSIPDDLPPAPRGIMLRKMRPAEGTQHERIADLSTIVSEPVALSPVVEYSLILDGITPLLMSRISPEIFFSIFLTALTGSTFFLMYRNMRNQQRLVNSKNDFINNVTHELKTPVATVSVALEALQNFNAGDSPNLTKEYLEIAQRELKRLNDITDRILKTSVLENEITLTAERCDLDELTRLVVADMKILLDQRKARVSYHKKGSDFSIQCDPYRIYQMIENLVDNALKYSPDIPVIDIEVASSAGSIELCIRDEGIGIEKEYYSRIFEKFFRIPTGDVHNIKGYGLGLSYVYNLVNTLKGKITVKSAPGEGTTFTIEFPRTEQETKGTAQ